MAVVSMSHKSIGCDHAGCKKKLKVSADERDAADVMREYGWSWDLGIGEAGAFFCKEHHGDLYEYRDLAANIREEIENKPGDLQRLQAVLRLLRGEIL